MFIVIYQLSVYKIKILMFEAIVWMPVAAHILIRRAICCSTMMNHIWICNICFDVLIWYSMEIFIKCEMILIWNQWYIKIWWTYNYKYTYGKYTYHNVLYQMILYGLVSVFVESWALNGSFLTEVNTPMTVCTANINCETRFPMFSSNKCDCANAKAALSIFR